MYMYDKFIQYHLIGKICMTIITQNKSNIMEYKVQITDEAGNVQQYIVSNSSSSEEKKHE